MAKAAAASAGGVCAGGVGRGAGRGRERELLQELGFAFIGGGVVRGRIWGDRGEKQLKCDLTE